MIVAGQVTGLEAFKIGQMAGRQLPLLAVFVPFWIVFIMDGFRGVRETWPAILVAGATFAFGVYFTSNFIGPELPDITSALISLVSLTLFLKVWKPKRIFRFDNKADNAKGPAVDYTRAQVIKAWSPFVVLTAVVTVWSLAPFKAMFAKTGPLAWTVFNFPIEGLDKLVTKVAPIVATPKPYDAVYKLDLLSATGTAILLTAIISIIFLRMKPAAAVSTFGETLMDLRRPIYSIGMVLAFAFIANYSGLLSTLAGVGSGYV